MKKVFVFILCVCVLLFSVPFASAATDHYQTFSHHDIPDPCLYYYQTSNSSSYATITGVSNNKYKQWSYVTPVNSTIAFYSGFRANPLALSIGNPMQISCDYFYLNSNGFNYMIVCSDDFASSIVDFLTTSQSTISVQDYFDLLLDPSTRDSGVFFSGVKYQTTSSTPTSPVCNYTVPSGYNGKVNIFFISVLPGARSGNTYLQRIGDIYLDPIGSSIPLFEEQQYRDDVIGSDKEGNESGLAGIFKKITQLPGQISGFLSGLGDRLLGSDEEGRESGLKGILKKIKDLPETISNKIKGLFIPEDGFFEHYKEQFDLLFTDHLGALYQVDGIIVDIISHLVNFNPPSFSDNNPVHDIAIPVKKVYINADSDSWAVSGSDPGDGESSEFTLIPSNSSDGMYHFDLSFLAESPYSTIYGIYKAVVSCVILFLMFLFARHQYDRFIGGNTG